MTRRTFLQSAFITGAVATAPSALSNPSSSPPTSERKSRVRAFELDEMTIADLQAGMASGKYTAVSLTRKYLGRIEAIDRHGPKLNSVIELNREALAIAAALDAERKAGRVRGPLHGIPVLIKDNIETHDRMMTTAGSLALAGPAPARDSFVAQRLRDAGGVLLGKSNLSEWANFR